MKIALLGYGKMGKEIEMIAVANGHEIGLKIDSEEDWETQQKLLAEADVAIEFSTPESTVHNIFRSFDVDVPVVVGTTGWMGQLEHVKKVCKEHKQTLFYASNFSIGVNIFFELNRMLAGMMKKYEDYEVSLEETHHTEKKDAPSGTAIKLAEGVMESYKEKEKWVNRPADAEDELQVISHRVKDVHGTHIVKYSSEIDDIEIKHTAKSRRGFALGAVMAAEWVEGKKGIFTMQDMLKDI